MSDCYSFEVTLWLFIFTLVPFKIIIVFILLGGSLSILNLWTDSIHLFFLIISRYAH